MTAEVERPAGGSARPLGLRPDVQLTEAQLRALRVIEEYDLMPIRDRLVSIGSAPGPRWAEEAIFEFKRYLGMRAVFPDPITMLSGDVDEVWHTCLVFTRLYADLCDRAFGGFLHHDPGTDPNLDRAASWGEFEEAYRSLYGEPGMLWTSWSVAEGR